MAARIQVTETRVQGFRALTIANELISFTIVPDLGGKISSICDLRSGREWLWKSSTLSYRRHPYGTSYVEMADTGGWDECFPTVAACTYPLEPWKGSDLPDHGEVWSQAWPVEIVEGPDGSVTVYAETQGSHILAYGWHRAVTLTLDAAALRFDYRVTSRADEPIAFIWSAHPLFVAEPGMRIQIPTYARMHTWLCVPRDLLPLEQNEQCYLWPVHATKEGRDVDLSVVPNATAGLAVKLWSEPLSQGEVALVVPDGAFRVTFDPTQIPQVGLWLNAGGWSGTGGEPYYNLALEPCIGAQDSLEDAAGRYGQYRILPPRQSQEWWLEIRLTSGRAA